MPIVLKDDALNYEKNLAKAREFIEESNPIYRCIVAVIYRTRTRSSCVAYIGALLPFLRWCRQRGVEFSGADSDVISDYLASDMTLSSGTRSMRLKILRYIYDEAVHRSVIAKDPTLRLKVRRTPPDQGPPGLTGEQARLMLTRIKADFDEPGRELGARRDFALVYVLLKMGLRTAEVRRLSYGDFTQIGGRTMLEVRRKGGKTGRLPVSQELLDVIDEWRATLAEAGVVTEDRDPVMCLLRQDKIEGLTVALPLRPLSQVGVYNVVRGWLRAIGVTGARLGGHRLRRSAATMAWEGKADLVSIQALLGHENVQTTIGYIRADASLLRPASDNIDLGS